MTTVFINYLRPPDRLTVFQNVLVHRDAECVVTFTDDTALPAPLVVNDGVVLENGSPALWLTFPDMWYDVGLFHTRDGTFTGYYANVLTPVVFHSDVQWETTDLFLDVWVGADGAIELLDEAELEDALSRDWITAEVAQRARDEALRLLNAAQAGTWPPALVTGWTLERARTVLQTGTHDERTV